MWVFVIIMVLFSIVYAPLYYCAGNELRRHIGAGFYICFAATTLAGAIAPGVPAFFFICFVAFVATVKDRLDAVCRFMLMAALAPNAVWHMSVGPIYLLDINTINVLALAVLTCSAINSNNRDIRSADGFKIEDALLIVLVLIASIGQNRMPSVSILVRGFIVPIVYFVLMYYVFRKNIRNSDELRRVIGCIAMSGVVLATFAVYEVRFGWALFDIINRNLASGSFATKSTLMRGDALRASTTMSGPLMLACYMVMASLATFSIRQQVRAGFLWAGWCVVVLAGFVMAQSRGNIVCLGVGVVVLLFFRGKRSAAFLVASAAALAGMALILVRSSSASLFGTLGGFAYQGRVYSDYRSLLLDRGLEEGAKHRWIGTSLDSVLDRLSDITQGQHIVDLVNTYLTFYLVSGLLGLVSFVGLLLLVFRKLMRRHDVNLVGPTLRIDRAFTLALLAAVTIELAFMSLIDRLPVIFMFVLAAARLIGIERDRAIRARRVSVSEEGMPGASAPMLPTDPRQPPLVA